MIPLIIVFLLAFVSVPVFYFFLINKSNQLSNVKGARTEVSLNSGLILNVKSSAGGWDLHEILCKTKDECTKTLLSGKEWSVVSGGTTEGHEIKVSADQNWQDYKYMKVFVRSGWGSISRVFKILPNVKVTDVATYDMRTINYENSEYRVLVIPLDKLSNSANFDFVDY